MDNGVSFNDVMSMDGGAFFAYLERQAKRNGGSESERLMSVDEFYNNF